MINQEITKRYCCRVFVVCASLLKLLITRPQELFAPMEFIHADDATSEEVSANSNVANDASAVVEELNNRYLHGEYILLDTRSVEEFAGCRVVGSFLCSKPPSLTLTASDDISSMGMDISVDWVVSNCIGADQHEVFSILLHRKETKIMIGTKSDSNLWAKLLFRVFRNRAEQLAVEEVAAIAKSSRASMVGEQEEEVSLGSAEEEEKALVVSEDETQCKCRHVRIESAVRFLNLPLFFDVSPILWSPQSELFVSKYQYKPPSIIISDFLYLSSAHEALDPKICGPSGYLKVTHIVNATNKPRTNPFKDNSKGGVIYLNIPVNDSLKSQLTVHFKNTYEFIESARKSHGKKCRVLVHCAMGISRSTSLVIYYLMRAKGMSLRDAYLHVKRQRPETFPNMAFMEQLIVAEQGLFPNGKDPSIMNHEIGNLGGLAQDYNEKKTPSTAAILAPSSINSTSKLQCTSINRRGMGKCSIM